MIAFPQLERLVVNGYGLYPGEDGKGGLDLQLKSGPWVVLGVNGLGKSTLLFLMRYLLTGPVRARTAGFAGEQREDLQAIDPRFFAVRVYDEARSARARIEVRFGQSVVEVERQLSNLALISATLTENGVKTPFPDEGSYKHRLAELMQLAQFEDAVRVLDSVVFFLEGRQRLVWDLPAQFEVFRALLTPHLSTELRRLEGEIISADSTARNLSAALFKITQRREKEATKVRNADDTRARIAAAQAARDVLLREETQLQSQVEEAEQDRVDHRTMLKRAEHAADDAAQGYEKLKFEVLRQAFAGVKPSEQYIFLRLISERICLVCSSPAEQAAREIEQRRDHGRCLVCGAPHRSDAKVTHLSHALKRKSEEAYRNLEGAREHLRLAQTKYDEANARLAERLGQLTTVRNQADDAQHRIRQLRKLLPADENAALAREEDRISTMRREVQNFRKEREDAEKAIDELLNQLKLAAEDVREQLEARFQDRAAPFFAERVRLVYAPRETKIGQGGRTFSFPAFEIEMTSGATQGEFARRRADQVSFSQREYLDLIFRMALIEVLGVGGGSLVVDGPEGSLDAVFAERAGDLFARFSATKQTNVILACNIVEGGFIPHTLRNFNAVRTRRRRVIDLTKSAAPTAALVKLRSAYAAKIDEILSEAPRN